MDHRSQVPRRAFPFHAATEASTESEFPTDSDSRYHRTQTVFFCCCPKAAQQGSATENEQCRRQAVKEGTRITGLGHGATAGRGN